MANAAVSALTLDQTSQVNRIMSGELGIETRQLMELAGQAVAVWARAQLLGGDARGKRVLVLAGSGGNGGDGMVTARRLHAWGARPAIWLSHEASGLHVRGHHPVAAVAANNHAAPMAAARSAGS